MPKLNLADFEALKNKGGLVPMVIRHPQAPYKLHQIAGFTPDIAFKQYTDGDAYPHGVSLDADDRSEMPTRILKPTAPGVRTNKLIDIPADVLLKKQGYSMKRLSLAARLTGKPAKSIGGDDEAIDIIKAAMEQRGMKITDEAPPPAPRGFPPTTLTGPDGAKAIPVSAEDDDEE